MVRISKHKQQQKQLLKDANIKVKSNKHNFSHEFARELYDFSEAHHKDHFKIFNRELDDWIEKHRERIEAEEKDSGDGGIYKRIKISARFYYRKKSKKEASDKLAKKIKQKKPYIGLSQTFIIIMDEYIKCELLRDAENIKRKKVFADFTQIYLDDIKEELAILKEKYDELETSYEPIEISNKFKKAFENRFYTFTVRS